MKPRCINKKQATIIPTVLFVAMFVVMMSTLMLAAVSYNLGMSLNAVDKVDFRYTSFAAVNELLSDINHGTVGWDEYKKGNPRTVISGGVVTESWIQPLDPDNEAKPLSPEDKKHFFAVARTYRDGAGHGSGETVKKLATYRKNIGDRIYANVTDADPDTTDFIYYNDAKDVANDGPESWKAVTAKVPKMRYNSSGTIEPGSGYAGTTPYITGGPDGSLYTLYAPVVDGWDDPSYTAYFPSIVGDIASELQWGSFTRHTIAAGGKLGMTVGDLAPIPQLLVSAVDDVTVSKGAMILKYTEESDEWTPLPAPEEATFNSATGTFDKVNTPGVDKYHLQGVISAPVAFDGGVTTALYRKGQDAIYTYTDKKDVWEITTPPGKDVLLLAADHDGTTYLQTTELQEAGIEYLASVLFGDLKNINVQVIAPKKISVYQQDKKAFTTIPNPPAKFFDKNGSLQDQVGGYPTNSAGTVLGPTLSSMAGGKPGELFVTNRPSRVGSSTQGLVDTIYKYSDGRWEVVLSPPNARYDGTGNKLQSSELPSRLDAQVGAQDQLVVRAPADGDPASVDVSWLLDQPFGILFFTSAATLKAAGLGKYLGLDPKGTSTKDEDKHLDGILLQDTKNKKKYVLMAPVRAEGEDGRLEASFSQMSLGRRKTESGLGGFTIHATYF